ncbi:uncharacterized aarF domain-containing protein kinase 5 [Galendromus occidentalis]|uniref:Uncharacterized aarF domain-containing protein kinase 5 n=1 Tax=Galendromus occidentalis TaxID=34638 RepID=A0AAJ7SJ02_9ACAR|nr:uncharacterized aarF domain-containing protein kinase 5 [Galendromus occidentalis]
MRLQMFRKFARLVPKRRTLASAGVLTASGILGYYSLEESYRKQIRISSSGIVRFLRTLRIGTIISVDYWLTNNLSPDSLSACHLRCSSRILDGCLRNGGVYVKLGQGLVAMNHILPEEYLDTLEVLHDRALRDLPLDEVEKTFIEDFGDKPQSLFNSFEPECVAAASLAQVFKAQTKEGRDVAVKIQYSDLRARFSGDVWTLGILVSLAGWMHPDYDFRWVLDYLRTSLVRELDFEIEAENMRKCARDLADLHFIMVPEIVDSLSSKRVLTMDWIDGIKINRNSELQEKGYSLHDIDFKLIKASSTQVFRHGFLHGDPHPGNVLVVPNPKKPTDPYLCLLDHGLYERLDDSTRLSLCSLWRSIVYNDDNGMRESSKRLGVPEENYRIFCELLVQRPLLFRARSGVPLAKGLSKREMQYMKEMAAKRFDEIMACLRVLPRPMLLVFRNINTVRSIAKTHGHPVDRFSVMAREADLALFRRKFRDGRMILYRKLYSNLIYVIRRAQLELFLVCVRVADWVSRHVQRIVLYYNQDVADLVDHVKRSHEKRERFLVE